MPRELTAAERERLEASQRFLHAAICAPTTPRAIEPLIHDAAGSFSLHSDDRRHLAAQDQRRLAIYRKLVQGQLQDALRGQIPLSVARMGDESCATTIRDFCAEQQPRTPIFREVAYEVARWASERWQRDPQLPPYLADLARYELLVLDVHCAQRLFQPDPPRREPERSLQADLGVVFDGSVRLGRFDWAVHPLADDIACRDEPAAQQVHLMAHRDCDNEFVQLDLTPLAFGLVGHLLDGAPLAAALRAVCDHQDQPLDRPLVDATAKMLEDLAQRGVLLGPACDESRASGTAPWRAWLKGTTD